MRDNMSYAEGKAIVMHAMDRLRMVELVDFSVMLYLFHLSRIKTFQVNRLEYSLRQIDSLLISNDVENSTILIDLLRIFNDDIKKIDSQAFYDVINPLTKIHDEWFSKYYISIFEELLFKIVSSQYSYEFLQPLEITKLISKLSGHNNNGVVYNPFAGLASYGIEMNLTSGYIAEELNEKTWAIGVLRLLTHNINTDNYICQDSILKWRAKYTEKESVKQLFDIIVSTPPFGMRIQYEEFWIEPLKRECNIEDFFIARGIEGLTSKGKLIGVFSNPVLYKGGATEIERKYAIDNDYLEMVVSLPSNLMSSTSNSTALLLFSKSKDKRGHVKFVDGSSFYIKKGRLNILDLENLLSCITTNDSKYVRTVPIKEIIENNYILNVSRYIFGNLVKTKLPYGFIQIKLADLTTVYKGEKVANTTGRIVKIADLSSDPFKFEKKPSDFEVGNLGIGYQMISSSALLLSKISSLKPTYCLASESEPVYFNSNIVALSVETLKINIAYLINVLNSKDVNEFVTSRFTGESIPSINLKDLLEIPIQFPNNLDQQKEIVYEAYHWFQEEKIAELGFEVSELKDARRDTYEKNMHLRKHALTQVLNKFSPEFSLLKLCKVKNGGHLADEMIVANRSGETVEESFQKLEALASKLEVLVNCLIDDQTYGDSQWIWIETFLEDYSKNRNPTSYPVKFYHKRDIVESDIDFGSKFSASKGDRFNSYAVQFSNKDLIQVLDNIVVNAEKYGFIDPFRTDYQVAISLAELENDIVIRIANNGASFHSSFSAEELFTWGGGDGTGLGLWQVKNLVEHFGGNVTIVTNNEDEYPVEFRILLPRVNRFSL